MQATFSSQSGDGRRRGSLLPRGYAAVAYDAYDDAREHLWQLYSDVLDEADLRCSPEPQPDAAIERGAGPERHFDTQD